MFVFLLNPQIVSEESPLAKKAFQKQVNVKTLWNLGNIIKKHICFNF